MKEATQEFRKSYGVLKFLNIYHQHYELNKSLSNIKCSLQKPLIKENCYSQAHVATWDGSITADEAFSQLP